MPSAQPRSAGQTAVIGAPRPPSGPLQQHALNVPCFQSKGRTRPGEWPGQRAQPRAAPADGHHVSQSSALNCAGAAKGLHDTVHQTLCLRHCGALRSARSRRCTPRAEHRMSNRRPRAYPGRELSSLAVVQLGLERAIAICLCVRTARAAVWLTRPEQRSCRRPVDHLQ